MNSIFILSGLGVISLLSEIFNFKSKLYYIVLAGLMAAIFFISKDWNTNISYFNDMLYFDNLSIAFGGSVVLISVLWLLFFKSDIKVKSHFTDRFALILFSITGALIMVSYSNLSMLFLGIEILSIPLYVLAGSRKDDLLSNEAALKYFLMGSFATGFLLFGIALVYGACGSFNLLAIGQYISSNTATLPGFFYAGVLMILIGFAFKVSAALFHFWAPDVYQGSPTHITAFMSTVVKTAAFAGIIRLFMVSFAPLISTWDKTIILLIILTLIIGNLTAIIQTNVKRLLAYSSIAHVGYILMALLVMHKTSAGTILYYTFGYSVASITAFFVINKLTRDGEGQDIKSFNGLVKRNPLMAFTMTIAMLSLAGIPPLAGFFAKYYIFSIALQSGYIGIVILAVITSLIAIYYYFKIMIAIYFSESQEQHSSLQVTSLEKGLMILVALVLVTLGLAPEFIIGLL